MTSRHCESGMLLVGIQPTKPTMTASTSAEAGSIPAAGSSRNPYASLIRQTVTEIPHFTLESGVELTNVPVAYKTWGRLNKRGDNCLVLCHALTGSADVEDWSVTGTRHSANDAGGDPYWAWTGRLIRRDSLFSAGMSSGRHTGLHRV